MNKILLFIGTVIVILAALFIVIKIVNDDEGPSAPDSAGGSFPAATTTAVGTPQGNTRALSVADGASVVARDFFEDADIKSDSVNPGHFYLGNYIDPGDPTATTFPYIIEYVEETDYFLIALFAEPIGTARQEAEQYLMEKLNLSQDEMCRLRYTVSVPTRINQFYAGQDLRFSFCPDSITLPG